MDKQKELDKIAKEIAKCQKCPLGQQRTKSVSGEGDPNTQIMFVGEAPGKQEDLQGKPFVGAAGKLLDELLLLIGLKRKDIFITNIVKCRPPANRDPLPQEIDACLHYLEQQIKIIQPKLIVTLGRHAM